MDFLPWKEGFNSLDINLKILHSKVWNWVSDLLDFTQDSWRTQRFTAERMLHSDTGDGKMTHGNSGVKKWHTETQGEAKWHPATQGVAKWHKATQGQKNDARWHRSGKMTQGNTGAGKWHTATQGGATKGEIEAGGWDGVPRGLEKP